MKTMSATCALFAALLFASLLVPTGRITAQSGRSWMNGFVFADSDVTGLAGAKVELIGEESNERLRSVHFIVTTEENGKYSIEDIPYGEYTFRVSADGYSSYEIALYVGSDMLTEVHVKLKKKEQES